MDAHASGQSTAFFYGKPIPEELMAAYDQVVVEPGHGHDLAGFAHKRAVPVAYLSVGEVAKHRLGETDKAWRLVKNDAWTSTVMDLSHPGYRAYLMEQYEKLWRAGYRRFFLDTLDSYQLGTTDPAQREQLRKALCELINNMAAKHPEAHWLLNRGFELLPDVGKVVHAVVAESLFDRFDAAHGSYVRVPKGDYDWLLAKLQEAKTRYHLQVIVIDYRPPEEREQARATAKKIADLGFEPWVCNGAINSIGVGSVEILPRRVLIVTEKPHSALTPGAARWLAPVLEYLGYVPQYGSVEEGLPAHELSAHVAGIVSVLPAGAVLPGYEAWLTRQVRAGVRVAMFGGLGVAADGALAKSLGILPLKAAEPGRAQASAAAVMQRDALIGFEAEPAAHGPEGIPVSLKGQGVTPHLTLRTGQGESATAIATTGFGGVALSHVFALRGLTGERAWVLDPFAFLQRALALPPMPVPDVTTENGRRVALLAIDARGLADNARLRGRPTVANVLAREILATHRWPHALDLRQPDASTRERDRHASAARALLKSGAVYEAEVSPSPGSTGVLRSLTELAPLWEAEDPEQVPLPIAADFAFIGAVPEAYPLRRAAEAWQQTEAPRRLRPLALHYHAFALSSPGGLDAVRALYRTLDEQGVHPIRLDEYRSRVRAFREQVVTRQLDGSFAVHGGEALRTLRIPAALGAPDVSRSEGVAGVAEAGGVRYVTFVTTGQRRLQLSARPKASPQLTQSNGRVDAFRILSPGRLQLSLSAADVLELRISHLPARSLCELALSDRRVRTRTDAQGELFLTLAHGHTGTAVLSWSESAAEGS